MVNEIKDECESDRLAQPRLEVPRAQLPPVDLTIECFKYCCTECGAIHTDCVCGPWDLSSHWERLRERLAELLATADLAEDDPA